MEKATGEILSEVTQVATAAKQQSAATNDINSSIMDIEGGVQKNADMCQKTFAASRSLDAEIEELIACFRVFTFATDKKESPEARTAA